MIKQETETTKQEMIAGIVFLIFGLVIIFYSLTKLHFGSLAKPGSGFFPLISGGGIALLSLVWILGNVLKKLKDEPLWEKMSWQKPLLAAALSVVYGLLMKPIGYVLATLVFMTVWQVIIAREKKWWKGLLVAIPATIGVYLIFIVLLRVPIDRGPWGF